MKLEARQAEQHGEFAAELRAVTHRYGDNAALNAFSLDVRRGEVLALLGPNGAGKTTAIKLLLGLLAPQQGSVSVYGASPRMLSTRQRTGAMLQVAKVPETLQVREYLRLFRSYYPHSMRMEQVVQAAGLAGIEKKKFGELSGGQRQRLLFGLALCGDPDLLFLDEPTLGMDIESRHTLWAQVRALSSRGKSVLLTTHYLEEADTLADRIVVIAQGQTVATGTPAEIKSRAAGRRIRCVTALPDERLKAIPGVLSVERLGAGVTLAANTVEDVLRRLLAEDLSLHSVEVTSANLEEAFLVLTQGSIGGEAATPMKLLEGANL